MSEYEFSEIPSEKQPDSTTSSNDNKAKAKASKPSYFLNRDDLDDLPDPVYLLDGLIAEGSDNLIYGEDGAGKSFICLDWACCLATGKEWQGRAVRGPCDVVYIYTEGWRSIRKRVKAWEDRFNGGERVERIHFRRFPVHISDERQVEELIDAMEAEDLHPELVIIDTLFRNKGPKVEINSDTGIGPYHEGTATIRRRVDCATLTAAHAGKDHGRSGSKGTTAIEDPMDGVFFVQGLRLNKKGSKVLDYPEIVVEKLRDDEAGARFPFKLVSFGDSAIVERDAVDDPNRTFGEDEPKGPKKPTYWTPTAAERRGKIMKFLLPKQNGSSFSELASKLKIPENSLDRLLKRMISEHLLEKNEETGMYRLPNGS